MAALGAEKGVALHLGEIRKPARRPMYSDAVRKLEFSPRKENCLAEISCPSEALLRICSKPWFYRSSATSSETRVTCPGPHSLPLPPPHPLQPPDPGPGYKSKDCLYSVDENRDVFRVDAFVHSLTHPIGRGRGGPSS